MGFIYQPIFQILVLVMAAVAIIASVLVPFILLKKTASNDATFIMPENEKELPLNGTLNNAFKKIFVSIKDNEKVLVLVKKDDSIKSVSLSLVERNNKKVRVFNYRSNLENSDACYIPLNEINNEFTISLNAVNNQRVPGSYGLSKLRLILSSLIPMVLAIASIILFVVFYSTKLNHYDPGWGVVYLFALLGLGAGVISVVTNIFLTKGGK